MSVSNVRSALITAYVDVGLGFDTVYDNTKHEPITNGPWAGVSFLPAPPDVATLGNAGEDELLGILQIDIMTPLNEGESVMLTAVDALRDYFTAGRELIFAGQCVIITNCGHSQGFLTENYFQTPVSVTWRSRLVRAIN